MVDVIAGRDAELASLREFVERIAEGSVALVLEGDAGMGKTTLWRAAVDDAEKSGLLVLQAQPVESETTLSYTGIGDLLEPVLDEAIELLPAVQQQALTRALALGDDDGQLDPRALRVALTTALRGLAHHRPVLIAIDDSQWLDYASAAGLAYAVRRFRSDRIGLLLSRRSGLESALLDELLRSPAGERFIRVDVGALDVAALGRAIHDRLGTTLARPLLVEVHTAAGGNPFYVLEIVRMLQRTGTSIEAGQPVPLPDTLQDLVRGRILALPSESREFLLAAAAHAHPTVAVTEAASGVDRGVGLRPALEAGVVELDRDRIRFTHPLLAAGVYEASNPLRRIEVHSRLADLLEDVEARAWQLAASVDEPDENVASVLEAAATHARARGALRPAALLLDRARELTPADDAGTAVRRGVDASFLHFESGDSRRAEAQLGTLIAGLAPGAMRAHALVRLARVRSYEAQSEAVGLFLQAVDEAGSDEETLAAAHEGVAACLFRLRERLPEAVEHAESAARIATRHGDEALAAEAIGTKLISETLLGALAAPETANRALALQDACTDRRVLAQPLFAFGVYAWWTDEVARAREIMLQLLQRARELGDESSLPYVLVLLGRIECQLALYASAAERARDGQEAAEQAGQRTLFAYNLALEALAAAHLGSGEEARTVALHALELVPETGGRPPEHLAREALGHLELASAEPAMAVTWLEPAVQFARAQSISEPGALRYTIDLVEALIELARTEEARDVLGWFENNARRLERVSALASCARCRGLLAAQAGDLDIALAAFDEALEWHVQGDFPLDRSRTLLALGAAQRRAKRRREARATLEEALAVFERIHAALWAERARAELKRISGRAATPGALTPAEERVAALVAEGKTNREVAAALFLSERTVEGHLSRIFGKLGIRHRTEIASVLAPTQTQGVPGSNTGGSPVSAESSAP
jgi:DNA-binding CsgD family transcriptional regulator